MSNQKCEEVPQNCVPHHSEVITKSSMSRSEYFDTRWQSHLTSFSVGYWLLPEKKSQHHSNLEYMQPQVFRIVDISWGWFVPVSI